MTELLVMEDTWGAALLLFQVWITVLLGLIMLPAMFGFSLGVTGVYIQMLVKILEVIQGPIGFARLCHLQFLFFIIFPYKKVSWCSRKSIMLLP